MGVTWNTDRFLTANQISKQILFSNRKEFSAAPLKLWKLSTNISACSILHEPHAVMLTYSLPSTGEQHQSMAHGRPGRLAQRVQALSVDVEKQASCKTSFVAFQVRLWFLNVCCCWVYLVICLPSRSSHIVLFREMPQVWDLTAGGVRSHWASL